MLMMGPVDLQYREYQRSMARKKAKMRKGSSINSNPPIGNAKSGSMPVALTSTSDSNEMLTQSNSLTSSTESDVLFGSDEDSLTSLHDMALNVNTQGNTLVDLTKIRDALANDYGKRRSSSAIRSASGSYIPSAAASSEFGSSSRQNSVLARVGTHVIEEEDEEDDDDDSEYFKEYE
jgi:hypothetical protein